MSVAQILSRQTDFSNQADYSSRANIKADQQKSGASPLLPLLKEAALKTPGDFFCVLIFQAVTPTSQQHMEADLIKACRAECDGLEGYTSDLTKQTQRLASRQDVTAHLIKGCCAVVDGLAILGVQQKPAQHQQMVLGYHVSDGEEIAQAL